VFDGGVVRRFRNFLNIRDSFGGENRPRGYPTRYLFGENVVAQTTEFRTKPLEILKTQWGLVFFHDAASAYDNVSELKMLHSVGAGIRALFPQFDRVTFRLDFGVPLNRPADVSPYSVIFTVDQAFSFPSIRENTTLE
jgi:hemolysin activation/secretion protein